MGKSGFVSMIGRSNVGKSTLLNALVGSKVAITTPKPQTTRQPIQGIVTEERGQIVFVDTPGVFQQARDLLTKRLLQFVKDSVRDVDVVLYVVDPTRAIGNEEHQALKYVEHLTIPKYLVINKMDERVKPFLEQYLELGDCFDGILEVSALRGTNLNILLDTVFEKLPEGEPHYPDNQFSSQPHQQWLGEIVREKLFLRLRKEVPYAVAVEVDAIEERANKMIYVAARILTNQERYKRMIIGAGGRGIKEIGQSVRKELEAISGQKMFIELEVEYDPDWVQRMQ